MLAPTDYEIMEAENGEEALALGLNQGPFSFAILPKRLRFCRGTPQKKGTGTMAGPPEARLAFGNNRRRRRSFALAVRCSVGLCVSPSDAKESQRRCRQ